MKPTSKLRTLMLAGYVLTASVAGATLVVAQTGSGGASATGSASGSGGGNTGPGLGSGTGAGTVPSHPGSGPSITGGGSASTGPTNPAQPQRRLDNADMCPPGAASKDARCRPEGGAVRR